MFAFLSSADAADEVFVLTRYECGGRRGNPIVPRIVSPEYPVYLVYIYS
jgi:hypothetical protein